MKSVLNTNKGRCYLCGQIGCTEEHHIFGGANRKLSEKHGLKVDLCMDCHRTGKEAVHNSIETNRKLQKIGQKAFEKTGSKEEFMKTFGRNYI